MKRIRTLLQITTLTSTLGLLVLLGGCSAELADAPALDPKTVKLEEQRAKEKSMVGARILFREDQFYTIASPQKDSLCAGDIKHFGDLHEKEDGAFKALDKSLEDESISIRPKFIKNVSLDLTDSNLDDTKNEASTCSLGTTSKIAPASACAIFDYDESLINQYVTSIDDRKAYLLGFNRTYYTMNHEECDFAGPYGGDQSRRFAGGAYIDLDRSALSDSENLLLHLTYWPLGPDQAKQTEASTAQLNDGHLSLIKVHLMRNAQDLETLRRQVQPRHLVYAPIQDYPYIVHTLSILGPTDGGFREDQIIVPISMDPAIDRIRIERDTGSAILIEASIWRLGQG